MLRSATITYLLKAAIRHMLAVIIDDRERWEAFSAPVIRNWQLS